MTTEITINGITVLLVHRTDKYADLIQKAFNQNIAAVPALADVTYDDAAMHGFGTAMQTEVTKFKATPPTATKSDVMIAVDNMVNAYNKNAGEIQSIAREEARAAGNVNVGINIVLKAGYLLKQPKSPVETSFTLTAEGGGIVDVDTKAPGKGAVYIRKYGITEGKNILPEAKNIKEYLISKEGSIRTEKLEIGAWYAFCEATIMPIHPTDNNAPAPTQAEEKSTKTIMSNKHRRTFINGDDSNYNFGPWLWILVS